MGGMVAQLVARDEPGLVRKLILTGTGPAGGEGIKNVTWLSHLDTIRGLGTLQDSKQFLFFTRTAEGKDAGKQFLARLKERKVDRDKAISLPSYAAQLRAIHRWGLESPHDRPARARRQRRPGSDGADEELLRPRRPAARQRARDLPGLRSRRDLPAP